MILDTTNPVLYFQFLHVISYVIFPSVLWSPLMKEVWLTEMSETTYSAIQCHTQMTQSLSDSTVKPWISLATHNTLRVDFSVMW